MNANRPTEGLSSTEDRHAAWLAIISGERRGALAALARAGLQALSIFYRAGVAAASLRFRLLGPRRVAKPVVSVGNLTVGGTGKTPMAAYLARQAVKMGGRPVIVSRGYAAGPGKPSEETLELARLCPDVPHVEGRDRWQVLDAWISENPCDVAILDDGFQHRRLARDLDIVLVDALRPFGYGHLLPRGLLRDPLSAIRRAGLVVMTRAELADSHTVAALKEHLRRLVRPGTAILIAEHRPAALVSPDGSRADPETLRGCEVAAVCGIGNPAAFRRTLEALGARVALWRSLADHHTYTADDLSRFVREAAQADAKMLVTTVKDYVKWEPLLLGQALPIGVRALEVQFRLVEGEEILGRKLGALLSKGPGEA